MKLSVESLHKSFRDATRELTVIDSLSFDFPSGSTVAIVGRSGIGKSTLLHLLGGLERPSRGRIAYDDIDLTSLTDDDLAEFRGQHVGFVFQFHHLLPEFDARENVAMPLLIRGVTEGEARLRAEDILKRVGLGDRMDHRPGELSGGEQQRVAISRAMVTKPTVVLADEPTGNLDYGTAKETQDLLREVQREQRNTLIIVTHNEDLAASMEIVLEMQPGGNLMVRR